MGIIYDGSYFCEVCTNVNNFNKKDLEERRTNPEKIMAELGVGKRYLGSTLENFKGGDKYVQFCQRWLKEPSSLYLYGPCGCGKTHLATAIFRELIKREVKPKMLFKNASDLFLEIRSTFNGGGGSEEQIVDSLSYRDFLFIDDMGAEKTSEWSRATMYLIIDRRDREMLPTIITSNLSPAQLGAAIDERISSRISNGKIVEIKMPDYRVKR